MSVRSSGGPRVIDLDLLYMEDTICYSPSLILPHPYVAERAFVLESLNEIAPHFVDPCSKKAHSPIMGGCQIVSLLCFIKTIPTQGIVESNRETNLL